MFDKEELLKILADGKAYPYRVIAKKMNIRINDNQSFSKFLNQLIKSGELFTNFNRDYYVPKIIIEFESQIRVTSKGFAFVDWEVEGQETRSVFVPANNVGSAMDKDLVRIKVFEDTYKKDSLQGIIAKILKRNKSEFVGRVTKFGPTFGIKPLDPKLFGKFRFESTVGLVEDMEVKVKIIDYDLPYPKIQLLKIIGMKDDVSADIMAAIEDANIPIDFSQATLNILDEIPAKVRDFDLKGRTDLRNKMIITIDGDDTKDFDDAIEIEKLANGNFLLGVHIADVTFYVEENTSLDTDAELRGTSIYLADRVIPMLPKELSNGICSLNPNVDRLVISCVMEIDQFGKTISYSIFPAVINSKYRLTYKEVNNFYRNSFSWENSELHTMLNNALELSKIIRKFKEEEGYIDFEIEESKIVINAEGKTEAIVPRERLESEMMIEDFMVRANEVVAKHVSDKKLPFIYRIHDKPDLEKVTSLQGVVKILGIEVNIPQSPVPKAFAKAINQIKETRFDDFMKMMMLRTMAKAVYSADNIGHFGLASKFYTHFTSPIRRYPDLMVHRMLREYFFNNKLDSKNHFATILDSVSERSSKAEQKAVELERRIADIKKAEFYEKFIGQSFEGTIVSMLNFGFFVEFPNKVGGLVHISTLIDGEYKIANNGYSITNNRKTYTIGDKIITTVLGAHKDEGKIDLIPTDLYKDWTERPRGENGLKKMNR